jgi:hypothetical protein
MGLHEGFGNLMELGVFLFLFIVAIIVLGGLNPVFAWISEQLTKIGVSGWTPTIAFVIIVLYLFYKLVD